MGYVGTAPVSGDYKKLDNISSGFNASATAFTLQVGSVNVTPPKETTLLISVGGIMQEPVTAYTVSGSTITFTAAPAAGADFFGVLMGDSYSIGTISDDSVTGAKIVDDAVDSEHIAAGAIDVAHMSANSVDSAQYVDGSIDQQHLDDYVVSNSKMAVNSVDSAQYVNGSIDQEHLAVNSVDSPNYVDGSIDTEHIADNQVTLAKMAGGTDGNIISYDASGDPVAIATGSDGQVLTSTGAGSPPAFEDAGGGGYSSWQVPQAVNGTDATFHTNLGNSVCANFVDSSAHQYVYFSGIVPAGMTSLDKANVWWMSNGTGVMAYDIYTDTSTGGEAPNLNNDSITNQTTASLTASRHGVEDVRTTFTPVVAGDRWGISFERRGDRAADTATVVRIYGIEIVWS